VLAFLWKLDNGIAGIINGGEMGKAGIHCLSHFPLLQQSIFSLGGAWK